MYLFSSELATKPAIRAEVDLEAELPLICSLANKFLAFFSPAPAEAKIYDEKLSSLVKTTGSALRTEVAERLAHVAQGP